MMTSMNSAAATTRRVIARLAGAGLLVLAAGTALPAAAQGGPGMGGPGMYGGGPGGPGGPGGGPEMWMGGPGHVGRMVDRMLDGLGATDAQRTQIRQIAEAAAADLRAQHDAGRALREKGLQILAAPTIDTAAAEAVRQQMLAQHDQASKRMLQAMLDMAKVLTPEQRAKLGERMKQRAEVMQERMQRMQRMQGAASAPKR